MLQLVVLLASISMTVQETVIIPLSIPSVTNNETVISQNVIPIGGGEYDDSDIAKTGTTEDCEEEEYYDDHAQVYTKSTKETKKKDSKSNKDDSYSKSTKESKSADSKGKKSTTLCPGRIKSGKKAASPVGTKKENDDDDKVEQRAKPSQSPTPYDDVHMSKKEKDKDDPRASTEKLSNGKKHASTRSPARYPNSKSSKAPKKTSKKVKSPKTPKSDKKSDGTSSPSTSKKSKKEVEKKKKMNKSSRDEKLAKPTTPPTPKPASSTSSPTEEPQTANPTMAPTTGAPSLSSEPSNVPTANPSGTTPTLSPTSNHPSSSPSTTPIASPSEEPTTTPSASPTNSPPSPFPTVNPTFAPVLTTAEPTQLPTTNPTSNPTQRPSPNPTKSPTPQPTPQPTPSPTRNPTPRPTPNPTRQPTPFPTALPIDFLSGFPCDQSIFASINSNPADAEYPRFEEINPNDPNTLCFLRMTANTQEFTAGSAFLGVPVTDPNQFSFSMTIGYRLYGAGDGAADGMVFVMHQDPRGARALGNTGGGIGVYGSFQETIKPSLAIEWDTFQNPGRQDVGRNNIHVVQVGRGMGEFDTLAQTSDEQIRTDDGGNNVGRMWVEYNCGGNDGRLDVTFNNTGDDRPRFPNLRMNNVRLQDFFFQDGDQILFVGYTASVGGSSDNHDIFGWEFKQGC